MEFGVIKINEITREETDLEASLKLMNPLPVTVHFDSVTYNLYINQKLVLQSTYAKPFKLNGSDSTIITIPVVIKNQALAAKLNELENNNTDSADYTLEGKLFLKLPVLKDRIHRFHISRKLPALRIPKITLSKISIKKLRLKHSILEIHATIENNNVFSMNFRHIRYRIALDGDSLIRGQVDTLIALKAKSKNDLVFPVDLNLKETAEAVFNYLLKPEKTTYKIVLQTTLSSEHNVLKNSRLRIENEGKLSEIKELTK